MASEDEVFKKMASIAAELLEVSSDDVKMESSFTDDLGADSLVLIEVIMRVEEEFDIEIPEEDSGSMATVKDAVKYVVDHTE
jgi:acyl carrier protein